MKIIVQRVKRASVTVDKTIVGEINHGLFVLIGIGKNDAFSSVSKMVDKLLKLRILADETGKMNKSIIDSNGSILLVSQFTLYADTSAGNRPSFINAAPPQDAVVLYNAFVDLVRKSGVHTQTGTFGAYMNIEIELDGPVTIEFNL